MAQTLDGTDGLSMGRPESPLHLGEDETAQDDAAEIGGGRKRKGEPTSWKSLPPFQTFTPAIALSSLGFVDADHH